MKIDKKIKSFKNMTILYVEDEEFTRKNISSILETLTSKIYIASNGKDGLETFKQNRDINMVITDLHMPFMNGFDMISEIEKIDKNIVFVITTSFESEVKIKQDVKSINICETLQKPILAEHLLDVLDKCSAKI